MRLFNRLIFPDLEKGKGSYTKSKLFEIIFEADTKAGRFFDISILVLILISVALVMLESVKSVNAQFHDILLVLEWIITIIFSIEYLLRIYCVKQPLRYIFSFYGIIDLLSILPTFLGIFYPPTRGLSSIRILRLFRIVRIFNLTHFLQGGNTILVALYRSRAKIIMFLSFITLVVVVIGSMMYVVESKHPESAFSSIPISIYWAVVTITTVGYGDIAPVTGFGKFLSSVVMIIGYGVIAVPTGFVTMEAIKSKKGEILPRNTQTCENCMDTVHSDGAKFCKSCGHKLSIEKSAE